MEKCAKYEKKVLYLNVLLKVKCTKKFSHEEKLFTIYFKQKFDSAIYSILIFSWQEYFDRSWELLG